MTPSETCELCDGEGRIWKHADPTSGQSVECECQTPSTPSPKEAQMSAENEQSDFDPVKLEAAQSDETEITLSRELATLIGKCLTAGLEAAPDDVAEQAVIEEAFDLAEHLSHFGRTGIDHPDAVFCIACGQPDEPELHDPTKCRGLTGLRTQASQ